LTYKFKHVFNQKSILKKVKKIVKIWKYMAQFFVIKGGKKLKGEIEVRGAKNAALKAFAAALLFDRPITIKNVPEVEDIQRISEIIENGGGKVKHIRHGEYKVWGSVSNPSINPELASKIRASIVLTGPMLARLGKVRFPHPGGCVIGKRPIDVFLDGFRALGAKIKIGKDSYDVTARKLRGAKYVFKQVSVTGTETIMLAAVLAKGKTILKNAACEPEIASLAQFLNQCGAKIKGAGTPVVEIEGVKRLRAGTYVTIPDRIETGTFAILAAATGSKIKIRKADPDHSDILWGMFRDMGIGVKITKKAIEIVPTKRLKPLDVKTHEYPGFPTDLQAPMSILLTQAEGQSIVHETIYEGRLFWTEDLNRMGAHIAMCDPHRVVISGPSRLRGRDIESPDIRAGMGLLTAALIAKGRSILRNVYQVDRGYEKIEERLQKIGADIKRK
jgi:UDP-N-acetylglucosamine 1-carboxyvinyltransferase